MKALRQDEARELGVGVGRRSGVEAEFKQLFDAFYPRLAGWTARLVDVDTAHDITSEAFTRLLQHWNTVEDPHAWLFMTCSNLTKDHWRRTDRERKALVRMRPRTEEFTGTDVEGAVTVRELVQTLPESLRVPVLLHYFADLPIAQIAQLTDRAEGTVKRALFDARAKMATRLQEVTS